jgi:hypothetical protein
MTILYPSPAKIKSIRFGSGILASRPTHRADYSDADACLNAEMNAAIAERDSHLDQMALEAEAVDRLCSGYCL